MNLAIHFKTDKFDVAKEQVNPINPNYGESLLIWLKSKLKGQLDISEPAAEDWGWYSTLTFEDNRYLIGASVFYSPEEDSVQELEWVFQIDKHRSLKQKLFGQNKMCLTDPCFIFFHEIISNCGEFKEVEVS
ncbi:hypothetical protein [Pseudoalteromonas obscura]|uniref:Integron gene cassette protein n=1 Tax=Pseudoalteromonas obscura TaxID=3048491 RepID=A0ABT7EE48_9GAMM|nr:hypothetical protein [Pseudoalteromonas sp. P94(2023)]MDK2593551.1 hypothetical protein [Pseudoalteromonas sp. P94(2023)]